MLSHQAHHSQLLRPRTGCVSFQEGVLERVKAHELRVEQWSQQLGGRLRKVEEEGDRVGQLVAERCAAVERRVA